MLEDVLRVKSTLDKSNNTIVFLVGDEVMGLMNDEGFIRDWRLLYETCNWATAFQSYEFVSSWYESYREEYLPLVAFSYRDERLVGLLPLAMPATKKDSPDDFRISGAGYHYAEYQCWISTERYSDNFITEALGAVKQKFPDYDIMFRYLPSGVPKDWLKGQNNLAKESVLQAYKRPIIDLNHPDFPKLSKKRGFKLKRNRLKREGKLNLVNIQKEDDLKAVIEELALQYDFRQGAMFNRTHFRNNALKISFLLKLFKLGLLHASLLKLDDEIIASTLCVQGKNWVHLGGINTHSPFHAQHSPGFVQFVMVSQQYKEEGHQAFDLTPGEEEYKERLSNLSDEVHELVVTRKKSYLTKRKFREYVFRKLTESGKGPMTLEFLLKKKLYLWKSIVGKVKKMGVVSFLTRFKSQTEIYRLKEVPSLPNGLLMKKNSLKNLMDFDDDAYPFSKWEVLEDFMNRFESGGEVYTWHEKGKLLAYAWVGNSNDLQGKGEIEIGAESHLISNFYCHPKVREKYSDFLKTIISQIQYEKKAKDLYAVARVFERDFAEDLKKAGFSKMKGSRSRV
jgi:CelD/BcsL family acetyltransferase involved in cellulose biosynthesis